MKTRYIWLMVIWSLMACQREEEVDLEIPYKRKLGGFMFIGSDMNMLASYALHTKPVTGPAGQSDMQAEPGINITVQRGNYMGTMAYEPNAAAYMLMMPDSTKPGQTFQVTFAAEGKQTTGITTLPQPASGRVQIIKIDSIIMEGGAVQYTYTFNCLITSPGKHYVQLLPSMVHPDSSWQQLIQSGSQEFKPLEQGQTFTATFNWYGPPTDYMVVRLLTADEAYAKYYNSIGGFSLGGLGPFSEPSFAYSNLSGGIGVVASYSIGTHQYLFYK